MKNSKGNTKNIKIKPVYDKENLDLDMEYFTSYNLKEYDMRDYIKWLLRCGNSMTLKEIEEVLK
jgi:hypothetical protein